jgi:hypothetical protein
LLTGRPVAASVRCLYAGENFEIFKEQRVLTFDTSQMDLFESCCKENAKEKSLFKEEDECALIEKYEETALEEGLDPRQASLGSWRWRICLLPVDTENSSG